MVQGRGRGLIKQSVESTREGKVGDAAGGNFWVDLPCPCFPPSHGPRSISLLVPATEQSPIF